MSHYQRAGLLLDRDDLHLVQRLLVQAAQAGRRSGGVPLADSFIRLKAQVDAAIGDERTLRGQEKQSDGYRLVTTAEYARLRNVTARTARRHAKARGHLQENGRYLIPIKE